MRSFICLVALCMLALLSLSHAQDAKSDDKPDAGSPDVQAAILDCLQANKDESFCIALLHIKQENMTESNVKVTADGGCEKNATDMTCMEHIHLTNLNETAPADKAETGKLDDQPETHEFAELHDFAETHELAQPVQRRRSPVTRALWFIIIVTVLPLLCCCGVSYAIYQLMCGGYYTSYGGDSTYV